MLVRILNTLPSRIWDILFFLFSDYSKSTVGEMEFSRRLWLSGKLIYPFFSVVAVFMMLVRILNTLPSRIWDILFFLFSDYSKSTVGEMEFSRRLWLSGKLIYPFFSVVAVFMMLVRILNTLPSRIWDRAFFLFSGYSKSTVDEKGGFSRWLWLFGKLIYPFFSIATIIELFAELQGNYDKQNHCASSRSVYLSWRLDSH